MEQIRIFLHMRSMKLYAKNFSLVRDHKYICIYTNNILSIFFFYVIDKFYFFEHEKI